jgi:hypothetical protein
MRRELEGGADGSEALRRRTHRAVYKSDDGAKIPALTVSQQFMNTGGFCGFSRSSCMMPPVPSSVVKQRVLLQGRKKILTIAARILKVIE